MLPEHDPVAMLGLRYELVKAAIGGSETKRVFEPEPGESEELYAQAPDGRWECRLDRDGNVETIFLHGDKGCAFPIGLASGMAPALVAAIVGEPPSRSEPERQILGGNWAGAYMRWDQPTYSMHAEFDRVGGLAMLTFMVPRVVP